MGRRLADAMLISVPWVSMLRAGRRLVGLPRRQLYPQQETISAPLSELPLSANCRLMRRSKIHSLYHFVSGCKHARGNDNPKRLGGFDVDRKLVLGRLLH